MCHQAFCWKTIPVDATTDDNFSSEWGSTVKPVLRHQCYDRPPGRERPPGPGRRLYIPMPQFDSQLSCLYYQTCCVSVILYWHDGHSWYLCLPPDGLQLKRSIISLQEYRQAGLLRVQAAELYDKLKMRRKAEQNRRSMLSDILALIQVGDSHRGNVTGC